jgi:GNAT superfamily N-acetyltransferase
MPSSAIQLRNLTEADIPFAMRLKTAAGWNQTEADWRRFLELEPSGTFLAEFEGQPAATVTALNYEQKFGWIGMMLVAPERRRLGIASALLQHSVAYLTQRGVETAKLDATPAGKTVYDQFGFHDEYLLERRLRPASTVPPKVAGCARIVPRDLDRVAEFDATCFGADRRRLLATLLRDAPDLCFQTDGGFVMGRRGMTATQIGPWVAENESVAERLLCAVLDAIGNAPVILDVPMCNRRADFLSTKFGFQKQRELIRQHRGPNSHPGDPSQVFGIAGPELG